MTGRWNDPSAFRADPAATSASMPSRRQTLALVVVLLLVAGAVALASYVVRPEKARAFDLFHGSLFLTDQNSPVALDLATGKPTLQLIGAEKQVGTDDVTQLAVVPLTDRTLLLNESSGAFNMVDNGGFVVKHDGGGVPLVKRAGTTSSFGVASDNGQAYIVRTGVSGGTDVYLVSQTTVESAIHATKSVRPRASTSMPDAASAAAGGAAAADGDLWLLAGRDGGTRKIRRLSVPAGSSAGADLVRSDEGSVTGAAAIGTATTGRDGSGTTVVGVASRDRIQLFVPGAAARTQTFAAPQNVDSIVPATSGQGRLAFLMHGIDGWSIVSVGADGSGLRGPTALPKVGVSAKLAPPAASNGALYAIDKDHGDMYRIGYDGTSGSASAYPVLLDKDRKPAETTDFADAYVVARGSRVVFNSAIHKNAVVLFTDDNTRAPMSVRKGSAVPVSASGGAEALAKTTLNTNAQPAKSPKPGESKPPPLPAPIDNKIDCKHANQKPHVPVIAKAVPGSRTVALAWTYQTFDNQDCVPSTYLIEINAISSGAPAAPSSLTVQGQTGADVSGLFPSTQYDITVTAVIGKQSTRSLVTRVTTGKEGPAAPTDVSVAADNAGNWTVNWNSCGGVSQGCVPAQTWTVIPSFCDGRGLSSPPTPLTQTADPTSRSQPPATYNGSDSLLGRGLQFQVQGTGEQGEAGTPSAKSACVFSWSPPLQQGVTLTASQPPNAALNGTTTTKVSLDLGANPVRAAGGVGAKITFQLAGGASQTKTVTYDGVGSVLTTEFAGLQPGTSYSVTARVSAPRHDGSSVTFGPQPVVPSADWPTMGLTAGCDTGTGLIKLTCDLSVTLSGLTSAAAQGEHFDIVDTDTTLSQLRCGGGPAFSLVRSGIDPGNPITAQNLSLLSFHGDCTVTVVLRESSGTTTPVFGGATKVLSGGFTVGDATTYDAAASDFSAEWDGSVAGSQVLVKYRGTTFTDTQVAQLTADWEVTVRGPGGEDCGTRTQQPTGDGIDVAASVDCVRQFGDRTGWSVDISYRDEGAATRHDVPGSHLLEGAPPGYQPCAPGTFTAAWGAAQSDGVTVTYTGDQAQLAGCSGFTYTLQDETGGSCTVQSDVDPKLPDVIQPACATPIADGWSVAISWHNDNTNGTGNAPDIDLGTAPPP